MFVVIRIIVLLAIIISVFFCKKIRKKALKYSVCILSTVIIVLSAVFPIENLFFSFSSSQKAFAYISFDQYMDTVYGKTSYMIIYKTSSNSTSHIIAPKIGENYQLPVYSATRKIVAQNVPNGFISIYSTGKDFYLLGTLISDTKQISLTDDEGNFFKTLLLTEEMNEDSMIMFYGRIKKLTAEYTLYLNGHPVYQMEAIRGQAIRGRLA